jgi:hypothetical protein
MSSRYKPFLLESYISLKGLVHHDMVGVHITYMLDEIIGNYNQGHNIYTKDHSTNGRKAIGNLVTAAITGLHMGRKTCHLCQNKGLNSYCKCCLP